MTESADPRYMSKSINLAQTVSDGMKIYVPKISEAPLRLDSAGQAGNSGEITGTETSLVNVNTASASELADKLLGVGPVTAQKIIDNRPYNGIEDLLTKKAVTRATYDKIKEKVTTW